MVAVVLICLALIALAVHLIVRSLLRVHSLDARIAGLKQKFGEIARLDV